MFRCHAIYLLSYVLYRRYVLYTWKSVQGHQQCTVKDLRTLHEEDLRAMSLGLCMRSTQVPVNMRELHIGWIVLNESDLGFVEVV